MRSGRNTRSSASAGVGDSKAPTTRTNTRLTTTASPAPPTTAAATTAATPPGKSKPCIVKLEKVGPNKEPEDAKTAAATATPTPTAKPASTPKPRITPAKKTPDRQNISTANKTLVKSNTKPKPKVTPPPAPIIISEGRSRRTPKPNPKYQNESLITSFKGKLDKSDNENSDDNIEDDEQIMSSEDEEFKIDGLEKGSSISGDDISDQDLNKKNIIRGPIKGKIPITHHPSLIQFSSSTTTSSTSTNNLNKSRPIIRQVITTTASGSTNRIELTKSVDAKKSTQQIPVQRTRAEITSTLLNKRKLEFEKERELQRKRFRDSLSDSKDKSDDVIITSPPPKQIRLNNRQSPSLQTLNNRSQQKFSDQKLTTLNRQKQQQQINLNGKNLNLKSRVSTSPSIKIINKKHNDTNTNRGSSDQIDDPDQVPTFTIVNINDIIGKKGDVLIEKSTNDNYSKSNDLIELSSSGSRLNNNNRRRPINETILSEKANKNKPQQLTRRLQPSTGVKYLGNTVSTSLKGPPRILNSGIDNKSTSLYSKNSDFESSIEKLMKNQEKLKENLHQASQIKSSTQSPVGSNSAISNAIKRKLPSEKVVIQRQGNKIIKKITCFETWYVINIPEPVYDDKSVNKLDVSLTSIANSIKAISLPSGDWTCKVSLQKLTPAQYTAIEEKNLEKFTGDVGGPSIPEEDKYKYQPISVLFRRNTKSKQYSGPYDRAVILKNATYSANIDGKNIKLVGAPQIIQNIQDLEILLQIVDEMTLVNQYVEPGSVKP